MRAKEFLEKWEKKINPPTELEGGQGSLIEWEFEEDVYSLLGEQKPQKPDVAFLNKWSHLTYMKDRWQEMSDDMRKVVEWAKTEGRKEYIENYLNT